MGSMGAQPPHAFDAAMSFNQTLQNQQSTGDYTSNLQTAAMHGGIQATMVQEQAQNST